MKTLIQIGSFGLIFLISFMGSSCSQMSLSKDSSGVVKSRSAKKSKTRTKRRAADVLKSKEAQKIYRRQGQRLFAINSYKKKGLIGESEIGTLLLRSPKGLTKANFNKLKSLVRSENRDRNRIYYLISKQSKYDKFKALELRKNMFKTRLGLDPIGTYYYSGGYWVKK